MTNLDQLLQTIAREEDELLRTSSVRDQVRERLSEGGFGRETPRRMNWMIAGVAAAAVAATLGLIAWYEPWSPPALLARDHHGPVLEGAWLVSSRDEDHGLRFSDGSSIILAPASEARVVRLGATGAHVSLVSGQARVLVVHRPKVRWELSAGPFTVEVTGTRFDVGYEPVEDRFELHLEDGSVVVRGCGFGKGRVVRSGERIVASCQSAAAPVAAVGQDQVALDAAVPSASDVVARAGHAGLPQSREKAREATPNKPTVSALTPTAPELANRANELRHEGNLRGARELLLELRRSFPGSSEAGTAAFRLGLIEFDGFGAFGAAATWFRRYLAEQPEGALSREARGRLMEALFRSSDPEAAAAARAYLERSPRGPHAELARRILAQP